MNRKLFFGMLAAAGMLLATSCSNDELDVAQSGNEAQVTFSLGLEGGLATRAISDGTGAKKLVYAVYKLDAQGNPVLQKVVGSDANSQFVDDAAFDNGLTETVEITLAKRQTYQVAFWAQNPNCTAYTTTDLTQVGVSYANAANNDENRDAFFKMVEFEVAGDKSIDVVMKRPFAQINVGVTAADWEAAVASGIEIENSDVVIKNAATSINLLTGKISGEQDVTYTINAIPAEDLMVDADGDGTKEAYHWLSMSYILVNDTHDVDEDNDGTIGDYRTNLESLAYTFTPASGNAIAFAEGLNNVPVQRNWRTNILGKILTGDIEFNITIDPAYDGDIIYPDGSLAQELEFAATFGGTVKLTDDVTLDETLIVGADMILDLNGKTITNKVDNKQTDVIIVKEGATLEINGDGNVTAVGGNDGYAIISEGTLIINSGNYQSGRDSNGGPNAVVYARGNGKVYIKGGSFKNEGNTSGDAFLINKKDADRATTTIEITGGAFHKFNPANNAAEGAGTNFCPEGCYVAQVGENWYVNEIATVVSTVEELAAALTGNFKNIKVILANNIDVPITSLGQQTGGSGEYKLGGENTETIEIDLNGKKLNITTTYWSAIGAKNDDATFTIKNGSMNSTGNSAGTWNAWDLRFSNCNYVFEDVNFEKAVALDNVGKSTLMKNVTITDTHNTDTYGLWITAEGQTVTLEDCVIDMTPAADGRGIKIDNQYVDEADQKKVTLNVTNVTFKTEEKAAILVKSVAGAEINASSLNISGVNADNIHAVWVDEDAAAYADKVVVNGASKIVEPAIVSTTDGLVDAFNKGGNVVLKENIKLTKRLNVAEGANVNLDLNGKTITLEGTSADPAFYTYKGSTLTITGNGTVEIKDPSVSLIFPGGNVVIENGTFVRNVPAGTPANNVGALFVGAKVSPWGSQTVTIKGGYFDGGYYNADAADIEDILAGKKVFTETADDIAKRGNSKDANKVRVAIKQNVQLLLNLSYNLFKVYGGTFVGANPAWGDEGCMLPTTPNYLRPWSYYQGALLDGQTFNENEIVLPAGYEITKGATADGRPTYTVTVK